MQCDFDLEELNDIYQGLGNIDASEELLDKVLEYIEGANELESLDMNECGDACKL